MNWVDLVMTFVIFFFALQGFRKPFFFELFDLFGFVLSFLVSLRFYNLAAKQLETFFTIPHSLANVLGFIVLWYLVEIVMFFLTRLLYRPLANVVNFPGNNFLSVVPAALKGLILLAVILELVLVFPLQLGIKRDIKSSKIGSWVLANTYRVEAPLKNIFGGLTNDTLSFLTIEPRTHQNVKLGFKNDKFMFDGTLEFEMVNLINRERMKQGSKSLIFDPDLRQIARGHSADMFLDGYFSHYSPEGQNVADRATKTSVDYQVIGENLAFAPSLELAHGGLMNSPGHRANILSEDFSRIGIGIASSEDNGIMVTQVFKD